MNKLILEPLVSVVIVTYNRSQYLSLAMESALSQTYPHCEIIVVDNGSTDNTKNIVQKYGPRIKYHFIPKQILPVGRNAGLRLANGTYIAFLDDDDIWQKNKIEKEVAYLEDHPEAAFVFSGTQFIDPQGKVIGPMGFDEDLIFNFENLYQWNRIVSPSVVLIRKQPLDEVGRLDESLIQSSDYDLWLRLSRRYKYGYIPEFLSYYRKHRDNLSGNLDRRALMHTRIFNKPEVSAGKTWWQKKVRIAQTYYFIADQYCRQGLYWKAVGALIRCFWICPVVGRYYWPKESKRLPLSFVYRILKVYGFLFWWLCLAFISIFQRKLYGKN